MTFNIRYDNPDDGDFSWNKRKEMVYGVIRSEDPDLIGFQEVLAGQLDELKTLFPGYTSSGVGRDDGKEKGEYAAIFFRASRFELLRKSDFWLSETPALPGTRSWGAACNRIVSWVQLFDRQSHRILYLFNTHFDHESQPAREESARLLLERIGDICGKDPVIVTGDFNETPEGNAFRILTSAEGLRNSADISRNPAEGPGYTFIGFPFNPTPGNTIDFIFLKNISGLQVTRHRVITDHDEDKYPSDHLPVMAELELNEIRK